MSNENRKQKHIKKYEMLREHYLKADKLINAGYCYQRILILKGILKGLMKIS